MSQSYNQPRAIVHRKILDVAEDQPDASVEAIASDVSGATTSLVSRVLESYGDPGAQAEDSLDQGPANADATNVDDIPEDGVATVDAEEGDPASAAAAAAESAESAAAAMELQDLSDGQRETLQVVTDRPTASQRDIANQLDVSQSTVNSRLNSIAGFEWEDRTAFAAQLVESDGGVDHAPDPEMDGDDRRLERREAPSSDDERQAPERASVDVGREQAEASRETEMTQSVGSGPEVFERLAAIERRLDDGAEDATAFDDPDLVRAVMQACFESDSVSVAQERRLVATLLGTDEPEAEQ